MTDYEKRESGPEDTHTRNVDDQLENELCDDTLYGEIIPSLFSWIDSESQERRVDYLNEISQELNGRKKGNTTVL